MTYLVQTLIDAVSLGSLYALAALGIGLLFGILRLINFAHGDFITVGAYGLIVPSTAAAATAFVGAWPLLPLIVAIGAIVVMVALISDRLVFSFLRRASPASLMIASFALGYVIQNLILMVYGARPKSIGLWPELTHVIEFGHVRVPALQLVIIGTTLALLLVLVVFLRNTRFGIQMRAASEDFAMARYLGVRADFVIAVAFAISGILASAVSLLLLSQTGVLSPAMGVGIVLYAFIATVLGGMGSLVGAVLGAMSVGIASSFLQAYLPLEIRPFRDAFLFGLVILILAVRPSGLVKVAAFQERV